MKPRATRWLPIVFFLFVWTLTTHGKFSHSGDEPHYLIIAESLLTDGDFAIENNYRNDDGRWFGATGLESGLHARAKPDGVVWSTHDFGMPVLVLPVYALGRGLAAIVPDTLLTRARQTRGLFAYSIVSVSMIALSAWGVSLFLSGLLRVARPRLAIAVTAVMALSPPFMSHAFLVFPDTVAATVACAVVWLLCLRADEVTVRRVATVVLSVGLLPWLHRKYSFLIIGLAFVIAHRHWIWLRAQRSGTLLTLAAAAILPTIGLYALTFAAWGNLAGPHVTGEMPFSVGLIPAGSISLLFDRERGLVSYAPIYLLLPACWVLNWRTHKSLLVPIALLFFTAASFVAWFAGFSPAARYLLPIVPLLVVPAAKALESRVLQWVSVPLLLFQAAISLYVWQVPRTLWPREIGTNQVLDVIPLIGPLYSRALPSMLTGDSVARGAITAAAVFAGTAVIVMLARRRTATAPGGGTR